MPVLEILLPMSDPQLKLGYQGNTNEFPQPRSLFVFGAEWTDGCYVADTVKTFKENANELARKQARAPYPTILATY